MSRDSRASAPNAPVKQFLFCDRGVLSVSHESVHLATRRGLTIWHLTQSDMLNLTCMSFTGKGTDEIVVTGCQAQMYRIDVEKGTISETVSPDPPVAFTLMRRALNSICAATRDGSIYILDPTTLAVRHSWKAYTGAVNDMDARGDYLLTCGWAPRHYQGVALEQLVRVYDLKNNKPAPPISFPQGAAHIRMHPKLSSTCMVISQNGAIYSIDVQNPDVPTMRFANTYDAQLKGLELMPSGKGFAMVDSHCQIVLWGSAAKTQFVEYGKPVEFADATAPVRQLDWTPETPLNLIGMPYYRDLLLSAWSNTLMHEVGAPLPSLDPTVLATMQKVNGGGMSVEVALNPKKTRRNQVAKTRVVHKTQGRLAAPKFLSEKPREDSVQSETPRRMSEDFARTLADLAVGSQNGPPGFYQAVEIQYSKFGIEDFDFGYYNSTNLSGLETHIVHSHANALLQLYRFTPVARNLALQHTAKDCMADNCLLCELGFLIDMLEKAKGKSCQASNFLKTLSKHPSAPALGILEESNATSTYPNMIQALNRFLLTAVDENNRLITGNTEHVQQAFGTVGRHYSRCGHCSFEAMKPHTWHCHDLVYPMKPTKQSPRPLRHYFSQILKASIERYEQQRGWCNSCHGYKPIMSRRIVHCVPAVLMLNAALHTAEAKQLWATPDFLPKEIGIIVNDGQLYCYEGQDLHMHLHRGRHNVTVYELVGYVADITHGEAKTSHLVSTIDAAVSSPNVKHSGNWHLFNDFLVRPIAPDDALNFNPHWKTPSIITYQRKSHSHVIDTMWPSKIDTSPLYRSIAQPGHVALDSFRPLQPTDPIPTSASHLAIDAEFVRLLREEIDISADGSRTITRPHRSGLARVSVLRGDEPDAGIPLIDDYIAISDPIDDYLTSYSGLRPGDLTPGASRFTLVNLKQVYKKLWILLNLGVTFIGHGLKSDFRIINIHVPEAQVIDTQELFSLGSRARRKLSLRFLAYLLLNIDIQSSPQDPNSGTAIGHDSIEDAATALKLWRKYLEFVDAGVLEPMLDEIWAKGKAYDFRVPAARSVGESLPGTPRRRMSGGAGSRVGTPGGRETWGSPLKEGGG